ncbi:cellulose synthase subunit D [Novosphingobium sp. PhB165]|uniref:cellulose biosynthesis protein BcsD n=1 Tax=Novosphingobium sp. PhB165 TaxID=2485105 RepID=UPI00104E206A|nr:cellulose biosynthesis protein BcsD [Novosphingobium sp. PhB165]TCM20764.1 cellulose synthase subunit D [Novosphingobium sp. PhB165]
MKFQAFPSPRHEGDLTGVGGLALLATMTAAEVGESAPAGQARAFFVAIGRRMATLVPLEDVSDVAALQSRINGFWQDLDWGEIELVVGEDAITVRHVHLPEPVVPDLRHSWQAMLLGVLEGAYDAWFRALGSGEALRTVAVWKDDLLEVRHGR